MAEPEEAISSLSSIPPVGKNILKYKYQVVRPKNTLDRTRNADAPIEFYIDGRNDQFTDVKVLMHICKEMFQIMQSDNFFSEYFHGNKIED